MLRRWLDQGRRVLPVSVNISRVDIREMDVVAVFDRLLKEYRIPVNYLEVEITESAYVENEAIIKEAERGLRELGLKILIDDFGSGYSSLNMLKDIQADILKLDMQFLNMDENNFDKGRNIVSSVIAMANQIDLPVMRREWRIWSKVKCSLLLAAVLLRVIISIGLCQSTNMRLCWKTKTM